MPDLRALAIAGAFRGEDTPLPGIRGEGAGSAGRRLGRAGAFGQDDFRTRAVDTPSGLRVD